MSECMACGGTAIEKLCDDCSLLMHQDVEGYSAVMEMIYYRMYPQPLSDPWSKV
jgi:hypothetical protein